MTVAERLTALGVVRRSASPYAPDPIAPARRALTAAASRVGASLRPGASGAAAKPARWQGRAWDYYQTLGEIHYAADFFGANLGRVRLIVERRVAAEGSVDEWEEVTTGPAFDAIERLRGPRGERSDIQTAFGAIMFVVGEGYLFGVKDGDGEVWEFLSADEVKVETRDRKVTRKRRHDEREPETYELAESLDPIADGEAVVVRLWTQHPRFSDDPDSPLAAVLDLCEELRLLPRAVRSRARSRLSSAGILVVPSEITEPAQTEGQDENPEEDPLLTDLIDTASTAIADEESAAAAVPIVLRVDGEFADKVKHLTFVDPAQTYPETERETHVLGRIAMGLNLPPEVLTGMGGVNHWSAWEITAAVWTQHLEPLCRQLCGDLTSSVVVPLAGGEFRVWYDDAELVTKPDRASDAQQLHDRLVISDEALRLAAGWTDQDEPDEDERTRRIGVMLKDAGLAVNGEVTVAPAPVVGQGPAAPEPPPAGPGTTEPGPPPGDGQPPDGATAGAMGVALARCREAAGAKVLTRLQRADGREGLDLRNVRTLPRAAICAALTAEKVGTLGLDAAALVKGSASCLTAAGYPAALAARVEAHAAATLFDLEPPPP